MIQTMDSIEQEQMYEIESIFFNHPVLCNKLWKTYSSYQMNSKLKHQAVIWTLYAKERRAQHVKSEYLQNSDIWM